MKFSLHIIQVVTVCLVIFSTNSYGAAKAELWDFWIKHDPDSTITLDHGPWQQLLDRYVEPGADGINRVDYGALGKHHRTDLGSYLNTLTSIDPRQLNRAEQFAYWVNLYNALTVEVVLRYPNKKSILRMGEKFFSIGPWGDKIIDIAGQSLTLDDIEHRVLRPIWQDHRIHYAVNCASIGCPNLSKLAYTPANTEAQLQKAEDTYTNHSRGVNLEGRKLKLSSIYKWYASDFGNSQSQVVEHLSKRNSELAEADLSKLRISYDYNWDLNRQNN
ncbi:MAG: DUF547 domain-containing protein [Pseudomonadota bacterium]